MNLELQEKLFKKYPKIFKMNKPISSPSLASSPFDCWGIEVNDGWYDLIDNTASKIQKILDKDDKSFFNTEQLKEKFSLIRWYYSSDETNYNKFRKIIDNAEEESSKICENCGTKENVSQNKKGYIITLCLDCRNK
jgi:hypothetical protein